MLINGVCKLPTRSSTAKSCHKQTGPGFIEYCLCTRGSRTLVYKLLPSTMLINAGSLFYLSHLSTRSGLFVLSPSFQIHTTFILSLSKSSTCFLNVNFVLRAINGKQTEQHQKNRNPRDDVWCAAYFGKHLFGRDCVYTCVTVCICIRKYV